MATYDASISTHLSELVEQMRIANYFTAAEACEDPEIQQFLRDKAIKAVLPHYMHTKLNEFHNRPF